MDMAVAFGTSRKVKRWARRRERGERNEECIVLFILFFVSKWMLPVVLDSLEPPHVQRIPHLARASIYPAHPELGRLVPTHALRKPHLV